MAESYETVDEYIALFPEDVQKSLQEIRVSIQKSAPEAVESIAYEMPAYKLNKKPLVYFGAFKGHIGFYGTPSTHEAFAKELAPYKQGKGSVQFPLDKPLPIELIKSMVEFKKNEILEK